MKVILLEKIFNLGELGETINVKPGYGRNFLVPKGKAIPATRENVKLFESRRAELEEIAAKGLSDANKRAEQFKELSLTITAKALEEGKLFGSIGQREILGALSEKNLEVEKREIQMPTGPIHEVGEFEILLQLHSEIAVPVKVIVEAEA